MTRVEKNSFGNRKGWKAGTMIRKRLAMANDFSPFMFFFLRYRRYREAKKSQCHKSKIQDLFHLSQTKRQQKTEVLKL
ncbi:MAG: hypothetical protein ACE5K0_10670 [Candidatus Methanofastidiosia archaeon]